MINQTLPTSIGINKHAPFGVRLKSAREALGMDRKDVASQLRLHETVIIMIESGEFKTDLPLTFIRGYIRNYSKLMEIPEKELNEALELLKPKPDIAESEQSSLPATAHVTASGPASTTKRSMPINIGNFFMQLSTYLLAITLIGLVGVWWHTHKSTPPADTIVSAAPTQDLSAVTAAPEASAHASSVNDQVAPDSKNPSEATLTTDASALPNAENPDSQTPPNANDPAIVTSADAVTNAPAEQIKPNQQAAAPIAQTTNIFNGDLAADRYIQRLSSLILFLIIITASIRIYAPYPLAPLMAGARLRREPRKLSPSLNFGSVLKLTDKFKISRSIQLSLLAVMVVSVSVFTAAWWYKHAKSTPVISAANQSAPIAPLSQKQEPEASQPMDANLETPSWNLNPALTASTKAYALQTMTSQLDDYISQAAATKFALTDKSTPIGHFNYKKKSRRHRQIYNNNYNVNANSNMNYNNSYGNSTPPSYYNQANGVSGQ